MNKLCIASERFFLFWINFNKKIFQLQSRIPRNDPNKKALLVFIIVFIGIFIIHSSSMQFFDYEIGYARGLFLGLFFSFANSVYQESKEKRSIKLIQTVNLLGT